MDKEDTHFCLRCRATIIGLDEYVAHRKSDQCLQQLQQEQDQQQQQEQPQQPTLFIPQGQDDDDRFTSSRCLYDKTFFSASVG